MKLHHDFHHAAYVNNLNQAAAEAGGAWTEMPLVQLLAELNSVPDQVRLTVKNNAGGHVNHMMLWEIMGGRGGRPAGDLARAIDRDFGSFDRFQTAFNMAGAKIFGAGWVFTTVSLAGKLAIVTKQNQETPLMDGVRVLFGNDVWEHAYYLKYQNRRADYLKAWWNVLDWEKIAARFEGAKNGELMI
jgi:Fe-Mn family superoxide dismutase